jgi:hypothetical protein
LAACSAIARSGERCKGVAIDGSGLCYAHHPDYVESRRRAARKGGKRGGRGRPVVEVTALKHRFEELAEDVLDGKVDRADAVVVGQLWNYAVRAVAVTLKAKEVEELEGRLEQLESLLESRNEGGSRGWG